MTRDLILYLTLLMATMALMGTWLNTDSIAILTDVVERQNKSITKIVYLLKEYR